VESPPSVGASPISRNNLQLFCRAIECAPALVGRKVAWSPLAALGPYAVQRCWAGRGKDLSDDVRQLATAFNWSERDDAAPILLFLYGDFPMSSQMRTVLIVGLVALLAAGMYRRSVTQSEQPAPLAPVDLVFVTGGSGPYWQIAANGARAAAKELKANVEIEMPSDAESLPEQAKILQAIDEKAVDGVAVSPLDAAGQTELINQLAAETFVVTFDSDAPDSKRTGYVGTSNFAAGRVCARLAQEAMPEGGEIAIILANTTKDNLLDRKGGFQEVIGQITAANEKDGGPKFVIIEILVDDGDDEKCADLIEKALGDHPQLACFVGLNARHGPILCDVLKEKEKLGVIKIIAFDEATETLDGIEDGNIFATVVQDPYRYGYESVAMLCKLARGDEAQRPVGTTTYSVSVHTIRKDTLRLYRETLKRRQEASGPQKDAA
jgi:ribose transport system substrate-binding protein